jgi:hypothetical protein
MEANVMLGAYSVPVILTVVLGAIYKAVPQVPDRFKPLIAAAVGVGLGIGAMYYNIEGPFTVANWIDYCLYGFMVGASAVGLWEMSKKMTTDRYRVYDQNGNPVKNVRVAKVK